MFTVSLFFPVCWIRRNNPRSKKTLELIEGAMVGVNERLKERGYFVPCQSEEEKICFVHFSFPYFCRPRSWSTLLSPHLIIISPVCLCCISIKK